VRLSLGSVRSGVRSGARTGFGRAGAARRGGSSGLRPQR
jgi:hypothetical protein